MKKSILISALALAALATTSCSNEETKAIEPQSNAIEFGTYLGRDAISRGSVFTTTDMESAGFGVFAAYTGTANFGDSHTMNFMYNQKVTKSGAAWIYDPLKYWPNNQGDKVSFFAYAPYDVTGANLSANTEAGAPQITFTVQTNVADQKDLTLAVAQKNIQKQSITGKVYFTFKHVLARIGLNVEAMFDLVNGDATGNNDTNTSNGEKATETTIKVTKVELIGKFDTEAIIDLGTDLTADAWVDTSVAAAGSDVIYTWDATNSNFTSVANDVTTTKQRLNADGSYAMIIPQDMTTNKVKIRVTYTVTTTDANLDGSKSEIKNVITSDEFGFNFEQGKAYMFNLHLGMTSVKFSATVSDWQDAANETVVNLPINFN